MPFNISSLWRRAGPTVAPAVVAPDFRLLAEGARDVIGLIGPDLRYRYLSPSSTKVLGWTPAQMVGKRPSDFLFAEDLAKVKAIHAALRRGEESQPLTVSFRRGDGTLCWVEVTSRVAPPAGPTMWPATSSSSSATPPSTSSSSGSSRPSRTPTA